MKKTAYLILCSAFAPTLFGVERIPHHKDYGSLVYVAAHDSCAADKARADVVCDGTNAAPAINAIVAQMSARDARGGKIVFFPGTYVVDSWMERSAINAKGGHVRRYGILVPHSQSEIVFEGIGYTHKDMNTSLRMNGKGAVFALSKRLWEAMEENGHYSLLGAGPTEKGYLWQYSWGFFRLKDVSFSLPSNDKAITVVDGGSTSDMSCEGVQISTDAPFGDDSRVNPRCIGIRTCCGGNNARRYALEFCKVMGVGTGFHIAAEHLIMRQCIPQRCAYGYVFGDVPFLESFSTASGNHPVTMINCCFEYCWYGITLGGSRHRNQAYVNTLTAIDLNAEEDDGYDAYTAWKSRKLIQDISNGYWRGDIAYFLTAKAKGHVPSARNLWGANLAEGANFRTVNTAARRRGPTADRPTSMTDLGFGYFDTDLNRMVWRTETGWSE